MREISSHTISFTPSLSPLPLPLPLRFPTTKQDALVLQVEGRKRWRLYDAVVEQPRPDLKFKPTAAEIGEPFVDFVLEAGDLLYLPSGLVHEARTLGGGEEEEEGAGPPSLHLTLGVESTVFGSWESLLLELVAAATDDRDGDDGGDGQAAAEAAASEEKEVLGLRCTAEGES
jgi:hypothetical protein